MVPLSCRKLTIYRPLQPPLLFLSSISSLRGAMQSGPESHLWLLLSPCCWQPLRGCPFPYHKDCTISVMLSPFLHCWLQVSLPLSRNVPLSLLWFNCWRPSIRLSTSLCPPFPLGVTNKREGLDSTGFAVFSWRLFPALTPLVSLLWCWLYCIQISGHDSSMMTWDQCRSIMNWNNSLKISNQQMPDNNCETLKRGLIFFTAAKF